MQLVPIGVPLTFEVTYDRNDLHIAMTVFNGAGSPVQGPTPMNLLTGTLTYTAQYTPPGAGDYTVVKTVYTDNTYTVPDSNYSQGSESIYAATLGSSGGATGCSVVGYVNLNQTIVGYVNCD